MLINIVNASVSAVWLILAVVVLRLLLRRAPKWITCLLWAMVGLRLVMPFSLRSVFSLIPSAQTLPQTIAYDPVPQIDTGVPAVNNSLNPILSEHFAATPQNSVNPMQILLAIGEALWIAGMIAMALYLVISYLVLRRKLRTATLLKDNIMQSERVTSPFVIGMFRPMIYLPYDMEDAARDYVIAHEQAHIRRGDHVVKPLAFLVLTLHWFNPFVWLAYILLCRDIELACDQRVVRDMSSADRKEYSRTLVRINSARRTASACPLAFSEVGVKERVKSVLNYKKPALWIIIAAVVACAVIAVCFLTDPVEYESIAGRSFAEESVVYHSPLLSSIAQPTESYRVTPDGRLVHIDSAGENNIGRLEEFELTAENFDDLIFAADLDGTWLSDVDAVSLRRDNRTAWIVETDHELYYLMEQSGGEVYIAAGTMPLNGGMERKPSIYHISRLKDVAELNYTDLDIALNKAAMEENKGGYLSGQFRCAAHTILATESEVIDDHTTRLTAYAIMLYHEYSLKDGIPEEVSGSSCPVAVTFDISSAGEYTLVEYWEPMDGSMYPESLREKFPSGVSWNTQLGHKERNESCYRQACEYFGVDPAVGTTTSPEVVPTTTTAVYVDPITQSAVKDREYELVSDEYGVIVLRSDGRFKMVMGAENTTELTGNYKESKGELILTDDDHSCEMVFAVSEGALTFDAQASAGVSASGVLADGALFSQKFGYMCSPEHSVFGPSSLTLRADGQATLNFGYLSSYIALGQFNFDGEILTILTTDGMNNRYVFEKSGEDFVYRAEDSSQTPRFKPSADAEPEAVFGDGAVFERA